MNYISSLEDLKTYLLVNIQVTMEVVEAINSYNGALDYLSVWENDEDFFNTFYGDNAMEAIRACYYGKYNYNDSYVMFDAYENLRSLNELTYTMLVSDNIDEIIRELFINLDNIAIYDEDLELLIEDIREGA